jgi:threonylcarbamoyladenosine tRNA methylthiotransferase MtaB
MKTVALETIGCRLNQYETEKIASRLAACGLRRVDFAEDADLYIVNTCTVTGRADASCRRAINRTGRIKHKPRLVVVGCYVTADADLISSLPGVDLIIGNDQKDEIVSILQSKFPDLFDGGYCLDEDPSISDFHHHNRAWVKIGDGCNQNCSFCIVPLVRGPIQNRPPQDILAEIESLVKAGYNEVVLTGVHIGQYRYDGKESLSDLIELILAETALPRLRLSSIEPQEVDDRLIALMKNNQSRICRHLHIPAQSGSDRILRLMRRPYLSGRYFDIIRKAKEAIENLVIGADIIVGFPGENDDDFEQSAALARSEWLDYLHVFTYSDRKGTDASRMPGKVDSKVAKRRNEILRAISDQNYSRALAREIGLTAAAISEHRTDGGNHYWGITDNYLKILIPEKFGGTKNIIKMKIESSGADYLTGTVLQ